MTSSPNPLLLFLPWFMIVIGTVSIFSSLQEKEKGAFKKIESRLYFFVLFSLLLEHA